MKQLRVQISADLIEMLDSLASKTENSRSACIGKLIEAAFNESSMRRKGGRARWSNLTPSQRAEAARKAAQVRYANHSRQTPEVYRLKRRLRHLESEGRSDEAAGVQQEIASLQKAIEEKLTRERQKEKKEKKGKRGSRRESGN